MTLLAVALAFSLFTQVAAQRTAVSDVAAAARTPRPLPAPWIAAHPDQTRDSLRIWIAATTGAGAGEAALLIRRAEQLASGYLRVWGDSFPLRDVRRFAAWPVAQRSLRLRADSLRRAGNLALGTAGLAHALADWRRSFLLARELRDTATMAAALGNIGAGFYRNAELDSARQYFLVSRDWAGRSGDRRTMLNAIGGLASVSKDRRDYAGAAEGYAEALRLRRQIGDYRGVAADASNLGLVAGALGNTDEARRRHTEALITAREHALDEPAAAALVNLGALAADAGDHALAERRYREALALYRKLGDAGFEALVLNDLGRLDAARGRYDGALTHYESATAILDRIGPAADAVATRSDLAHVLTAMGRLDEAEVRLRDAEAIAQRHGLDAGGRARLRLLRGTLSLQLNHLRAARTGYEAALGQFRAAGDSAGEAEALAALGELSLMEGDPAGALTRLRVAAARHESVADERGAALTRVIAAQAARELGDTAGAERMIMRSAAELRRVGDRVAESWAHCQLGEQLRGGGRAAEAEKWYRHGMTRLGSRLAPDVTVCLYAGLGAALRMQRADRRAVAELERGVAAIEAVSTEFSGPARRADYLGDKWDVYVALALAQRATGDAAGAFHTSERLRARETLELFRTASGSGPSVEAHPRVAALRRRITALLGDASQPLRGDDALDHLPNERRAELTRAQDAYAALLDSLGTLGSARTFTSSSPPAWREIANRLPADAAMIEYLVADSAALAFVVAGGRLSIVNLPTTGSALANQVDFVRGILAGPRAAGASATTRAPFERLRGQLITPIEKAGLLGGVGRLLIVAHRELHYLPFAALVEPGPGGRYLIEQFEIGSVPSAAMAVELGRRTRPAGRPRILALAPQGRALPGATSEVAAIARLFGGDATVLTGARASRDTFILAAPHYPILHLATLGVLNKHNPRFSYVELAPGLNADGRLEVHDVSSIALQASLVVLSACQTALGSGRLSDVPPGDDWVGMVQAFHAAGSARVLATLWPVNDRSTAQLMTRFYAELRAGNSASSSLAKAQRALLRHPRTRSPFHWAGFVLHGTL